MTKTPSPLLQLLNQDELRISNPLEAHYDSVFQIANGSLQQLMDTDRRLHISEARAIHEQARAITAITVRQFREQRLTTSIRRAFEPGSGIRGLVDAPTYNDLFRPDWANHCPTDAIEATTSPIAYLADLYREVQKIEQSGPPGKGQSHRILLAHRRPDLAGMKLDHSALERVEPTLVLVNEILETSARRYLNDMGDERSLDDVMLDVRYPLVLPYERYQQQINYALKRKERLPGDVIRCMDPAYPYFKEVGVHSLLSDIALVQDTGFGPVQQGILLEAPFFPEGNEFDPESEAEAPFVLARINPRTHLFETADADPDKYFKDNFGEGDLFKLLDTQTFCLHTGLKTEELESLLSVGAYAPYSSVNLMPSENVDGAMFGSVYVNAGVSPAMAIETTSDDESGPIHRIVNWSLDRFDRLNRMIRLAQWLKLPFDQVDRLLVASIRAERKTADYRITADTLRAIGLFQGLRTRYKVSVDDFAALLQGLAMHGRGKQPTQFDQIFNSQALFPTPLILDGEVFSITPVSEAERQKVDHLCAALGMTYEMYRFTAKVIEQSYAGDPLRWNAEVVSAFYRLVRLPHYLGLTTIEALALLELLDNGGSQLVSKLAGPTHVASYQTTGNTDTLSVIHALVEASAWMHEHGWTIGQLCRLVLPALTKPVASEAELNLLNQMHSRLEAALISDSSFAETGAPETRVLVEFNDNNQEVLSSVAVDWFELLRDFIETGETSPAARGLVKYLRGETEENFEEALRNRVSEILVDLGLPAQSLLPQLCNMIMRARGAQEALLMEGLAGYLDISVDLVKVLLFWAEGDRYQLLMEVLRVFGRTGEPVQMAIGDEVLLVLDSLAKRAAVARHLDLSEAFVGQCLEYPQWFGLGNTRLSLQTLYFFSEYAFMVRLSAQPEEQLLDYLRLINTVWKTAGEGDKRLIRDSAANKLAGFLNWGVRQVLAVAFHLHPIEGVIFTLADLDLLVRTCRLARHTRLDAEALLALGTLTPTGSVEMFRYAAELALASLTEPVPGTPAGEVGQSHSSQITVTSDYLVAKKSEESTTYHIILRDFMDDPYDGVTITWSTDLGSLGQPVTVTTEEGESSVTLESGDTMGIAHVVAEYGLGDKVLAPVVTIGCDEGTLHFFEPTYDRSEALSNKLEAINFSVTLVDGFGNEGIDRLVRWGTTRGEFQRYQTQTNHQGISRSSLRSGPLGEAQVIAQYANGIQWSFPTVTFTSTPYFQYVRFDATVVENIEVGLSCRLVELNGDPVAAGTVVTWAADSEGLRIFSSETDSNGIAQSRFRSEAMGAVIVTVSAENGAQSKSSVATTIYPVARILRHEASEGSYMIGTPDAVVFSVWLTIGGEAGRGLFVEWKISGREGVVSRTDNDGMASFTSRFSTLGPQLVTATIAGQEDEVEFVVKVYPRVRFAVELLGPWGARERGLLSRGSNYSLNVKLIDDDERPVEGVEFTLDSLGVDLEIVSVVIPNLGGRFESSIEGVEIPISLPDSRLETTLKTGFFQLGLKCKSVVWTSSYKVGMALDYLRNYMDGKNLIVEYQRVDGEVDVYYDVYLPVNAETSGRWRGSGVIVGYSDSYHRRRVKCRFGPVFDSSPVGDTCTVREVYGDYTYVYARPLSFVIGRQ